jgi:WD40 repeat protein/predicted Ser/Thr protein kinase
MSEQPGDRVQIVFDQAVALPPEQRAAFLDVACGGDAGLRAEVESLLACDTGLTEGAGREGVLRSPLVRATDPTPGAAGGPLAVGWLPGGPVRVGHYRILRRIAEGGMGAVYEAEQDSPRRTVALKVVRAGIASPALVKRFSHEAQILGRLHHPGIAQVYEAGLAADGQPYFAMEFIRGLPLDEYARRHGLGAAARAGLLARVCDAVQHAHDQGIIHRDLKPANILVDGAGQPKVLDFGVARATDADLLTSGGLTQTGQLLGTPNYMSPEQVTADPAAIDRRSDVYALGVVLFEMLAHRLPYQLDNRPLAEAARLILEEDSLRLGSVNPEFRGDVETIVAKALEKDPARRYQTAAELAADLRGWLAHEPILARPPSALYHLRKFARRHTALVGGVVATGLALVLGLVFTTLFAVGEARQRRQADDEKREALFQAYRARIAAAVGALAMHDVADARRQLDAAPQELRDWEWHHLHSRLDDSSEVIPVPADGPTCLVAIRDRLQLVTLTPAGLRFTGLEGGEPWTLPLGPEHRAVVCPPIQTRRGLRTMVWGGQTTTDLLDEAGGVICRVEHPEAPSPLAFNVSADGTRLAYARFDGGWVRLAVYDAMTGKQTAVCDGHRGDIWSFTFSPDGTRLASGGEDGVARVWDPATGALLAECHGHTSKIIYLTFRPDGARLVTTSSDGTVRQWDAAMGREAEPPYDRHSGGVACAVYSPDGQRIASVGTDRTVRVWQAKGRQDLAVLHGHTGGVVGVGFMSGGHRLASLSRNTRLVPTADGTVRLWEVDPRATLPVLRGHRSYVYPVAFSPDGRWIASGGWDKDGRTARLWDAATGEPCATLPHPGFVLSLAFGPEGQLVTGCFGDEWLRVWDVATGRVLRKIPGPGRGFRFLTVSPDGKRVAATADPALLRVYDLRSGEPLFSAEGRPLAYSPDGRWLAVVQAADEKTVVLLDARTYEPADQFRGHKKVVTSATFSPDSRRLASCSQDGTVRVWEVGSGACQEFRGHTDEVFAAAFHPDGRRLATAGRDRAIWLWDLGRGEEVARLQGHTEYVWSLAFSPDGTTLASGSGDFTVRLWDTAPLKARYQARSEAAALRPEAERRVEQLWREKNGPAEVVDALRADPALVEPLRQAAWRAVLRRSLPPDDAAGNPLDSP